MSDEKLPDEQVGPGAAYGVWAEAVHQLISYRYLGCRSTMHDRSHATGRMRVRSDMRTPGGGLLSAPLAIAMLDTAGINVDRHYQLALTHVDVDLFDTAPGVVAVTVLGEVVREARSAVFTEARFTDAADHTRLLGFGSADWVIVGATPPGFAYVDPGPGVADSPALPPLWAAYDAQRRPEGGFVIPTMSPRIGTTTLHHGPILVTLEAAAQEAAARALGDVALTVRSCSTRIVQAGRQGPFVATAEVLRASGAGAECRATLHDTGTGATVAIGLFRLAPCG